jgi:HEPN domain-containing protein/predicted nucleotidyltransferase
VAAAHSDPRIRRIVESLRAYDPERVIVFGSVARGQADAFSDLDIVVIKETDERFVRRLLTAGDYLPLDCGSIDILVYTPGAFVRMQQAGNPFIAEVVADGVTVYERSRSVAEEPVEYRISGSVSEGVAMRSSSEREARRWLDQAEADRESVVLELEHGYHNVACFLAQQMAEKTLKAFLYLKGERHLIGHSVADLCRMCARYEPRFADMMDSLVKLDRYYIPTRSPNGLPGGLPSDSYDEADAHSALGLADRTLEFVRALMPPMAEAE